MEILLGMHEHLETWAERNEHRALRGEDPLPLPPGHQPTDHELLYPGDQFEIEELLVRQMPPVGWSEPVEWNYVGQDGKPHIDLATGKPKGGGLIAGIKRWDVRCAKKIRDVAPKTDVVEESRILRAEPSDIRGINISEKAYDAKHETEAMPASMDTDLSPVRPDLPRRARAGVK